MVVQVVFGMFVVDDVVDWFIFGIDLIGCNVWVSDFGQVFNVCLVNFVFQGFGVCCYVILYDVFGMVWMYNVGVML